MQAGRGFLWSAVSLASNRITVFVVTLALARLLAPQDFGVIAAGLTLIAFLEVGLDLGVGAAVVYEQEQGLSARVRTAYSLNLIVAVLLAGAGCLAAPALAGFFHSPGSTGLFRALFGYLVLRGAGQVQASVLQRDLRYRERTVVDVARALVRGGTSLALAATGAGPGAIVAGLLCGETVALALACSMVRLVPAVRFERAATAAMLRFGAAVLVLKLFGALLSDGDNLIIGNRSGTTQLGLYSVAYRLPELCIESVYWVFSSIAFSLFARARTRGPAAFRVAMLRALRLTTTFGFATGTGLAVVAPIAVPTLFGARWGAAVTPTVLLSLATGLGSIGYASGDIYPALGRPGVLLRLSGGMTVVALLGFWYAAPRGIAAVAAVHLVFQLVYGLLRLRAAHNLVGSTWREDARALLPGVATAVGICCLALPVSLVVAPGLLGLVATVLAGGVGAAVATGLFGRAVLGEFRDVLRQSRGPRSADRMSK